jgi:hypothetical protein
MLAKRGAPETLRWRASDINGGSRSTKALQTASAKSMMKQRRQNRLSRAVTEAGRDWPDKSPSVYRLRPENGAPETERIRCLLLTAERQKP